MKNRPIKGNQLIDVRKNEHDKARTPRYLCGIGRHGVTAVSNAPAIVSGERAENMTLREDCRELSYHYENGAWQSHFSVPGR
jgi:hypothetical protein